MGVEVIGPLGVLEPPGEEGKPRLPPGAPGPRLRSKESTRATSVCSDLENSEQKHVLID